MPMPTQLHCLSANPLKTEGCHGDVISLIIAFLRKLTSNGVYCMFLCTGIYENVNKVCYTDRLEFVTMA
jgi:hypothetical protein